MSTRTNVILKEGNNKLFFYRHSDGYPECTVPSLNIFMEWLRTNRIRNNLSQGSGWLVMLGAIEYNTIPKYKVVKEEKSYHPGEFYENPDMDSIEMPENDGSSWKVGAYEPTIGIHGDIEYLYIIDLDNKTLVCYDTWTEKGEGKNKVNISKYLTNKSKVA